MGSGQHSQLVLSYLSDKRRKIWVSCGGKKLLERRIFSLCLIFVITEMKWASQTSSDWTKTSLHAHFESNLPLECNLTLNFKVFSLEQKKWFCVWMKVKFCSQINPPRWTQSNRDMYAESRWSSSSSYMTLICERNQSEMCDCWAEVFDFKQQKSDTSSQFIYWINLDKHQNLLRYNQNIWGRYPTMHHPLHETND